MITMLFSEVWWGRGKSTNQLMSGGKGEALYVHIGPTDHSPCTYAIQGSPHTMCSAFLELSGFALTMLSIHLV